MTDDELVDFYNPRLESFINLMGGRITAFDTEAKTCTFEFDISTDYCHSGDIVQGGFVTAMLDAAMSHAVFASEEGVTGVSSLEIKTSYLEPTRAGRLRAVGRILKSSYKTVFLEGSLYDSEGLLLATTSSVAKLGRPKS